MCAILELFFAFFFSLSLGVYIALLFVAFVFGILIVENVCPESFFFFFYISPLPVLNLLWMVLRCLLARTHHRRCKMVTVIATTLNCFCGCRFFFFFFCKLFRVYVLSAPWVWSLLTPCLSVAQTHSQLTNYVKRNKTRKKWQCCRRFALVYERMCLIYYPYLLRAAQPVVVVDISIWHSAVSLNFFCTCW